MLYQLSYFRNKNTGERDDAITSMLVPRTGLEPARLAAHAPETCASTNSATWALRAANETRSLLDLEHVFALSRAANETRTRDPDLGKVVLYQLSYCRL